MRTMLRRAAVGLASAAAVMGTAVATAPTASAATYKCNVAYDGSGIAGTCYGNTASSQIRVGFTCYGMGEQVRWVRIGYGASFKVDFNCWFGTKSWRITYY